MSDRTREYAVVERHRTLQPSYYELRLRAPVIAGRSRPGQFVFIRVGEGFDPLLRRPISICDADAVDGTITLLYQAVGRGTDWLSHVPEGAQLDLMGPIGTPFPVEGPRAVLVAGGLGVFDPQRDTQIVSVFERADAAMYENKKELKGE